MSAGIWSHYKLKTFKFANFKVFSLGCIKYLKLSAKFCSFLSAHKKFLLHGKIGERLNSIIALCNQITLDNEQAALLLFVYGRYFLLLLIYKIKIKWTFGLLSFHHCHISPHPAKLAYFVTMTLKLFNFVSRKIHLLQYWHYWNFVGLSSIQALFNGWMKEDILEA